MGKENKDYLLGVNKTELDRLGFQHGVWKGVTDSFFERLGVGSGWKVLDAGAGPGYVSFDLRERVGAEGEVTALEPSDMYVDYFRSECEKHKWKNMKYIHGSAETAELPQKYYNLIFSRWVIGFVPDAELFVSKLAASLAPGGVLAIQDYAFGGFILHPRGGAYENFSPAVEAYWKTRGGDLCIAARLPEIYRKNGLELVEFQPNCLAGGPESGIFEWHHRFLTQHAPLMVEINLMSRETGDAILNDWHLHRANPDAVFFSPLVVDAAGKKRN